MWTSKYQVVISARFEFAFDVKQIVEKSNTYNKISEVIELGGSYLLTQQHLRGWDRRTAELQVSLGYMKNSGSILQISLNSVSHSKQASVLMGLSIIIYILIIYNRYAFIYL